MEDYRYRMIRIALPASHRHCGYHLRIGPVLIVKGTDFRLFRGHIFETHNSKAQAGYNIRIRRGCAAAAGAASLSPSSSAFSASGSSTCVGRSMPIAVLSNGRSKADMKNTMTSVPIPTNNIMFAPGR